jgi:hypothetical protein
MNEVLEHVEDELQSLAEIRRVLKPGGYLVCMSPNRWFPFEGHGARIGKWSLPFPVPLLPWVPQSISLKWMCARNWWPHELRDIIARAGFVVERVDFVLPVLDKYPVLPAGLIRLYRKSIPGIAAPHCVGLVCRQRSWREHEPRFAVNAHIPLVYDRSSVFSARRMDDASFDGVLLNEVLGHVSGELATWREMRPVLQRTGHVRMAPASAKPPWFALASRHERATVSLPPMRHPPRMRAKT